MKNQTPYCLMPWIHFHVGDDGISKACCVANIPFGNVNTQSFDEIWNGKPIQKLRSKFLSNEPDKRCAQCYKLEQTGGKSIRKETFEKFPNIEISTTPLPIYFDIRFSNICNLKCRTCWHGASSAWFEDAKKLGTNKGQKAVIKNVADFDQFIDKLGPALKNAQEIYLAGGEPLVMEEHYRLLKWLITNGNTKVKLRYNTNFTFLKFKAHDVLEYWKHFDSIEILASIDATQELGSYIRSGTDWNKIISNFNQIKSLNNVTFKISPTVSVLNILKLPELITECLNLNMITENDLYINILERPIHYNIQTFNTIEKQEISTKLESFMNTLKLEKTKSQLQEILDYLGANDLSKHREKFAVHNGRIDLIRGERLPE